MLRFKSFLLIILAFIAGSFVSLVTTLAFAHGGDTNLVHACVRNTIPNLPNIRIVDANTNCNANETALDWPKTANSGGNSNFICIGCDRRDLLTRLNRQNLLNANLDYAIIQTGGDYNNEDFTGTSLVGAVISVGSGSNFTDTNFTDGHISGSVNANFTNANLTRIHFNSSDYGGSNFTNATLINATFDNGTNLANTNFTNTDLTGTIGITTESILDAIWNNTTCPDGTNSNDNGNTCEGHLIP